MKIVVVGLWHLGCVTAACLANAGHEVIAYAGQNEIAEAAPIRLHTDSPSPASGRGLGVRVAFEETPLTAPLFEPGLDDLLTITQQQTHTLTLIQHPTQLTTAQAEIIWITFDTPVNEEDIADVEYVIQQIKHLLPYLSANTLILISSQLPVGSTRQIQRYCTEHFPEKNISFAYSPENLRLGQAIQVFTQPDRVIVGLQQQTDQARIRALLKPFTENIIFMSIESAEMTKHALNAFLATSVVFINELASLCERVGADAREVEQGLKSEQRIGKKAYLRPGNAIAGGTLARDVNYLMQIGQQQQVNTPLFSALLASNQQHKQWSCRKIVEVLENLTNKTIAVLGLTYKADTDTLRRSTAIEFCQWLKQQGANITAFDPAVKQLEQPLAEIITLKSSLKQAVEQVDAIVIATEWPQFTAFTADELLSWAKQPIVLDASGFLMKIFGTDERIKYYYVGR
ncbi:MAG TPA: nucleotide sugar dehydrogenase [Gammaproteobacteria bacterium]|jgi:UDPglucose 6-dehydrogenase|nr:nucleotide sugar dehydrogenase [Gammaproteobacteria bacterium]